MAGVVVTLQMTQALAMLIIAIQAVLTWYLVFNEYLVFNLSVH